MRHDVARAPRPVFEACRAKLGYPGKMRLRVLKMVEGPDDR